MNNFYSIPPLIEPNIDIFAIAAAKLDSSFPESQFLQDRMKKPYRFDVSSRKEEKLVYVNKDISSKYPKVSIFLMKYWSFLLN